MSLSATMLASCPATVCRELTAFLVQTAGAVETARGAPSEAPDSAARELFPREAGAQLRSTAVNSSGNRVCSHNYTRVFSWYQSLRLLVS